MSHFFMTYSGNKRNEINNILPYINHDKNIICEPFCGSCAISYNLWKMYPNKKYYMNDNNPLLIELYNKIKTTPLDEFVEEMNKKVAAFKSLDKEERIRLLKTVYPRDIYEYYILNKATGINIRFINIDRNVDFKIKEDFYKFISSPNVYFICNDWKYILETYNNNNTLILCDPPYLKTDNTKYINYDNNNIIELYESVNYNEYKSDICFIIPHEDIYNTYLNKYDKKNIYSIKKKSSGYYKNKKCQERECCIYYRTGQ